MLRSNYTSKAYYCTLNTKLYRVTMKLYRVRKYCKGVSYNQSVASKQSIGIRLVILLIEWGIPKILALKS